QGNVEVIQSLMLQALQGLAYLHNQNILHGDLKPENLLVTFTSSPNLKIIDFSISHPHLINTGGTPAFLPPEKILKEKIDQRSDLYSLAVIFYQALTGVHPFERPTVQETLRAHLNYLPSSATIHRPQLDPIWAELLDSMLQKNPRFRISSA